MIGGREYKFISDSLGQAYNEARFMYRAIGDMRTHLQDNELNDVNIEKRILEKAISDTYIFILSSHVNVSEELKYAVRSLNEHLKRRFDTVDAYLEAKGIKVSEEFAALAAACGYDISAQNIE